MKKMNSYEEKNNETNENNNLISKDYLLIDLINNFNILSNENKVEIYFSECDKDDSYEKLFCEYGFMKNEEFDFNHRYYGSSTRLGKDYEIFNPENGFKYKKFKIKINDHIVFEEYINFKKLSQEFLKLNSTNYCDNYYEEMSNSIELGKSCPLNSFTNVLIKHNYLDLKFYFRDLHRFDYIVEVSGICFKLNLK